MKPQFRLRKEFVDQYRNVKPPFGFGGLGEFVFYRTYSRQKEDGTHESWVDVVERVVNETYTIQMQHILENNLPWSTAKAERSAEEMFERIFYMKFLPPGRGLWSMGSPITSERNLFMALHNCAFVSTRDIVSEGAKPFIFLMDVSMLGVGCGFDTRGAGTLEIRKPNFSNETFVIPDSREGWCQSVEFLLNGFLKGTPIPQMNYLQIRPYGEPIRGFGGVASGPEPLKRLHEDIIETLSRDVGKPISSRNIVDIMNMIGRMVVAGNVRRTAELALGVEDDTDFLDLKNYQKNPERAEYGWTSNNSIVVEPGADYHAAAERTRINGEPGYIWLENARKYGRLADPPDMKDFRVDGFNPCVEQPLESYETCVLVETFPAHHDSIRDFLRTLKFAYLYAKTTTLRPTHWPETNRVLMRNRRIGTSVTGVVQAMEKFGIENLRRMFDEGYRYIRELDAIYSDWLCVPRSIKVTTCKPSGTVSILAGATPGVHFPENRYYIRRVRVSRSSPLLQPLVDAGYHIEAAVDDPDYTVVVEFPVEVKGVSRTISDVTLWEQLEIAAFVQSWWSDNGVSLTVTFRPEDGHQIEKALQYYQYRLKAVSFLPAVEGGAFAQMPYEAITRQKYEEMLSRLKPLDMSGVKMIESMPDRFCDSAFCEIPVKEDAHAD